MTVPTLSPRVQTALALIHTDADLRLRTTIRRDDVDVWTSRDLSAGFYETSLRAPDDVLGAMGARRLSIDVRTDTPVEAIAAHDAMVRLVTALLQRMKEQAS